jgi:hypothetical protein
MNWVLSSAIPISPPHVFTTTATTTHEPRQHQRHGVMIHGNHHRTIRSRHHRYISLSTAAASPTASHTTSSSSSR